MGSSCPRCGFAGKALLQTLEDKHRMLSGILGFEPEEKVQLGDINEGLAQYLSGKRLGYRLDPGRAVVRDGRMKVDDYYDSALSFVEYLIDCYRQPAMNELLETMGETGDVDQAFRRDYKSSYAETREEWLRQLK